MRVQRNRVPRRPLPADLRGQLKADLRKMAGTRARKVGEAHALRASKIADAKAICSDSTARAEREYDDLRKATIAGYEARAARRLVATVQAATS